MTSSLEWKAARNLEKKILDLDPTSFTSYRQYMHGHKGNIVGLLLMVLFQM